MNALIKLTNGETRTIGHSSAVFYWKILTGRVQPSEAHAKNVERIAHIYLNWRSPETPDEYIQDNFDMIVQMHFGDWMVNREGQLVRPEPTRPQAVEFAKKWGLYSNGQRTKLAYQHITKYYQQLDQAVVRRMFAEPTIEA